MLWSQKLLEQLITLADERKSAREIAERLSQTSGLSINRNMVSGKCDRAGIRLQSTGAEKARLAAALKMEERRAANAGIAKPVTLPKLPAAKKPRRASRALIAAPLATAVAPVDVPALEDRSGVRDAFMSLEPNQCMWPTGDPQLDDFSFCCAPVVRGSSYCAGHVDLGTQPRHRSSEDRVRRLAFSRE